MFDGICILIALYLYSKVSRAEKSIAFTVLCFFVVSDVVYNYLFKEFRSDNHWVIYWLYSAVNLGVIYNLKRTGAHLVIMALIAANVLLNIVVSFYFISKSIPYWVYNLYPYPAGFIMVSCLIYLWMLQNGARRIDSLANNQSALGVFFRRGDRLGGRGLQ